MATNNACKYTASSSGLATSDNCCKSNKQCSLSGGPKINYETFYSDKCHRMIHSYLRVIAQKALNVEGKRYSFSSALPNPCSFPYEKIQLTLKDGHTIEIKDETLEASSTYLRIKGYNPLLNLLKHFQDQIHGNQDWSRKDMCLSVGALGGIFLVVDAFINDGDPVLVNSPTYTGFLVVLKPYATQCLEIASDDKGIDAKQLETVLSERKARNLPMPKILYVNPTGTNPTGAVVSTERKKEIYGIACKYNFLILEDDTYHLIHYQERIPTSFLSLDTEHRVIRIDTFSKILGAGFRVGYITGAKEIIEKLDLFKEGTAMVPALSQVILHETLAAMGYEGFMKHTQSVKEFYYKNCKCILAALEEHMKGLAEWDVPEGGMFIWMKIKHFEHISESFIDECIKKNILVVPGFAFYANPRQSPYIRLTFSRLSEEEINEGVKMFAEVLKAEISKNINCGNQHTSKRCKVETLSNGYD